MAYKPPHKRDSYVKQTMISELDTYITQLIQKIIKYPNRPSFKTQSLVTNKILSLIKKNIFERKCPQYPFVLHEIHKILVDYEIKTVHTVSSLTENRQSWIADQIIQHIKDTLQETENLKIADFGCGEGYVINHLGNSFGVQKENLYAIEQIPETTNWVETYKFPYKDSVSYKFWDWNSPETLDIAPKSVNIVLLMSVLHHMTTETIYATMQKIRDITDTGSLVYVKEHDIQNEEHSKLVDMEHHLYYLMEAPVEVDTYSDNNDISLPMSHIEKYLDTQYVTNFKTKAEIDFIFATYGFASIDTRSRLMGKDLETDTKNPTRMYWNIYQVK